ncbi:LOG family protein yvdD [Rickettsiales bacterium Ac37b]|nr:LOG family protein yvdD [Rickettsiales bacterium Ac37b]
MEKVHNIGIFCGASPNIPQNFLDEAYNLGKLLAQNKRTVVYGGSKYGAMGAIADGALSASGEVIGVFPQSITIAGTREIMHTHLTKLITVPDMHSRKMSIFNLSDAFITFPGGFGTMDETFEIITWKYLKMHKKPIIIYNYQNYYNGLIQLIDHFIDLGFANSSIKSLYHIVEDIDQLLNIFNINQISTIMA